MGIESFAYFFFGNNVIIGPHIRQQLKFLKEIVPPVFQRRQMDDLGCGDGKVTMMLKDAFLPAGIRGFDVNQGLVRRARQRGIEADVRNLDEDMPAGELAVLWGVLHHLKDQTLCLNRIKRKYALLFIREPVRTGTIKWLELGHPLTKDEIEQLVKEHLPGAQVFYHGNSVFIFYVSPEAAVGGRLEEG